MDPARDTPSARGPIAGLTARGRRLRTQLSARRTLVADRELVESSGVFDPAWYLAAYPDVAATGLDALDHFLRFGGTEGRDPGPRFSSGIYRRHHPGVAASGQNPLVHWLRSGKADHDATPAGRALLEDPRILFVHIPKTAGTSIYTALMWWATKPRSIRFERGGSDLPRYLALPDAQLAEARLIGGHLWYPDLLRRDLTGWSPVTLLRDPVARALSTYTFIREDTGHPWHAEVAGMDLDAFLDWLAAIPHAVDEQCRFICGAPDAELAWTTLTERFTLVATVDDLVPFEAALSRLIGSRLELLKANRSKRPIDPATLPASTLARIETLSRQDRLLVERVRAAGLVGTGMALIEAAMATPWTAASVRPVTADAASEGSAP